MPGSVIQISPKQTLDFTNLAVSTTLDVVLAQGVDVSNWPEASLMVRVHDVTGPWAANSKIEIFALVEGRTAEDPGQLFVGTTQLALVTLNPTPTPPTYSVVSLNTNFGALIRVIARGTRGATAGATIKGTISVDLSVKSA